MKRVTCRVHPDWVEGKDTDSRPDLVVVKLKNGKELSHEVAIPKGDPRNPMSEEELASKYRECASFVLSPQDTQKSVKMISHLEDIEDITELINLVR